MSGEFGEGELIGEAEITWKDGTVYQGFVRDYLPDGKGIMTTADAIYTGDFVNGTQTGQGIKQYKDGTKYTGSFKQNKYSGQGLLNYSDGIIYEG